MQKSPSEHHRTNLSGYIFATKAHIDNRKKLLNSNIFSTCPHIMADFGLLAAKICWRVWDTPSKFQRVSRLDSLLQRRRSPEVKQTCPMFGSLAVWTATLCIHFREILRPDRILPGTEFTLRPSLAFSYIGSVTCTALQTNFASWYKKGSYRTFAEGATYIRQGGHHVGNRPTF